MSAAASFSSQDSHLPHGVELLRHPLLNKATAFSEEERDQLGLRGLLPPRVVNLELQVDRVLAQLRCKSNDLEKYIFLSALQQRNETLFYKLLIDHLEETMPIIYTPTVGQACLEYGSILRHPRGLWITSNDRGRIASVLRNWPQTNVRVIVVTDGERILGLGDLGAYGMGIPVGKLALYSACAGVHPSECLPITIDVGTENPRFLEDPFYIGLPQKRVRGEAYEALMDEFIAATQEVFPGCLVQFEDFANHNAFTLLEKWRDRICCFNDDIQGTAAVALAGLIAATKETRKPLADQTVLFLGAGEAGTGIAGLFVRALVEEGMPEAEARKRCWFVDSKGLLVAGRDAKLPSHKAPYAHEAPQAATLAEAVERIRPTALIGVAGIGPAFTAEILQRMGEYNHRPIIFALSNPTSKAECTPSQAYEATGGRAIYASGSPFAPVELGGRTFRPGQGNNVYIFPGVGLGVLAANTPTVTDTMFLAAARALAAETTPEDLAQGCVYPQLTRIREVSQKVAMATANEAVHLGLARNDLGANPEAAIASLMFQPSYPNLVTE
ncbi:MAG: NAD-dependent malic enzyme [Verrucomicrobia bacterium]|nr:NAD-dependent malic enzyme [Verrucomicrobiota bacterium]